MSDTQCNSENPFGFLAGIFGDPLGLGPAMAFYGREVCLAIMKQEAEERAYEAMRRATASSRIDDVSSQVNP